MTLVSPADITILLSKAVMAFFAALLSTTTLGYSMNLIVIPQCLILMACFYLGRLLMPILSDTMFANFLAVGGLMTFALGLSIAGIKKINAANLLPGLLLAMPASALLDRLLAAIYSLAG